MPPTSQPTKFMPTPQPTHAPTPAPDSAIVIIIVVVLLCLGLLVAAVFVARRYDFKCPLTLRPAAPMSKSEETGDGDLGLREVANPIKNKSPPPSLQQFLEDEGASDLLNWLVGEGAETVSDLACMTADEFQKHGLKPLKARNLVNKVKHFSAV